MTNRPRQVTKRNRHDSSEDVEQSPTTLSRNPAKRSAPEKPVNKQEGVADEKWKCVVVNSPTCRTVDGVRFSHVFKPGTPSECTEAIRAATTKGSGWKRRDALPGIPGKRFNDANFDTYGTTFKKWRVQAIYANTAPYNFKTDEVFIHFEGWTPDQLEPKKAFECVQFEMWQSATTRWKFLAELNKRDGLDDDRMDTLQIQKRDSADNVIWDYEDMTYFHSMANKLYGGAGIHYICRGSRIVDAPRFQYIPFHLVDFTAYEHLRKAEINLPFQLLSTTNQSESSPTAANVCETPETCKCDARFALLYGKLAEPVEMVKYRPDARLDLAASTDGARRLVMECSDECGCSIKCPRRRVQRGQTKPLMVCYEDAATKFGVRAGDDFAKGEFIAEYTGRIRLKDHVTPSAETSSPSYEADWNVLDTSVVVDSAQCGNVTRFLNHSCSGNTRFIEVYSREKETDVLVPRIAVVATRKIRLGDKITLHYWPHLGTARREHTRGARKCACGSKPCIQWLPTH